MRAFVRFLLPDGSARELSHGDVIGRLASAELPLDDERLSEAHAMVRLRVRSDRHGHLELVLYEGDVVEDRN